MTAPDVVKYYAWCGMEVRPEFHRNHPDRRVALTPTQGVATYFCDNCALTFTTTPVPAPNGRAGEFDTLTCALDFYEWLENLK